MRCSLNVRTVLFLTIAAAYIVQARKPECMCGNLGSGINPCRCGEVVVKAAKVQKPLFYASPEAINQAAAAREIGMRRFSAGPVCGNVVSFPKYNRYTSGTYSTSTSSGSSSASSGSISSSASSVGSFGEPFGGSNGFRYSFYPSTSNRLIDSGCGCGKKSTSESLETRDLLSHNIHGKVVPRYPEEKLQILDKPVVELKPILPTPVAFGVYNEQEEAKLAELEAINGAVSSGSIKSATHSTIDAFNAEDGEAAGYGPLGPPMPDYVPGNVVINRELVKTEGEVEGTIHSGDTEEVYVRHYSNDEASEEEDDIDGPTAGIFARLKSVARKHNPTCLQ